MHATALRWLAVLAALVPPLAGAQGPQPNGIFLVARRGIADPNFRETVVLVTQPPRGGPVGLIVNRPLGRRLSELFPGHEALASSPDVLFEGGPVARDTLFFLVRASEPPPRAFAVLRGVYLTGDLELLERLLQRPQPMAGLRVYAGYSGWAPGQLEREIARGDWHLLPADAETVFEKEPARIWPELEKRASTRRARTAMRAGNGQRVVRSSGPRALALSSSTP